MIFLEANLPRWHFQLPPNFVTESKDIIFQTERQSPTLRILPGLQSLAPQQWQPRGNGRRGIQPATIETFSNYCQKIHLSVAPTGGWVIVRDQLESKISTVFPL